MCCVFGGKISYIGMRRVGSGRKDSFDFVFESGWG